MKVDIKSNKTKGTIEVIITLDSYVPSNKNKIKVLKTERVL